jgi:porin
MQMQAYFLQEQKEPRPQDFWHRPYMMGDWGGVRQTLADKGITICASFITDDLGNPIGGKAQGFAYAGSYQVSIHFDFSRVGVKGLELLSSASWRSGNNLSNTIDNQFKVAHVFGFETVRFIDLYLRQSVFREKLILKAGRLCCANEFLNSPLYRRYVNKSFNGYPEGITFNVPFTSSDVASWAALAWIKPWHWLSAKFGVYNGNEKIQENKYHGVNFTFSSHNRGVLWLSEWRATINQQHNARGMPGNYKLGFFYLTGQTEKFSGGIQRGDPGVYLAVDQMLYRAAPERGLTPFLVLIFQPKNRNLFPFFTNGGVTYQGLFPHRPKDTASFGFAYAKYSPDLARKEKRAGKEPQGAETILEWNYAFQLNPWFVVRPDLQYIIHPKGRRSTPNALVLGVEIGLENW